MKKAKKTTVISEYEADETAEKREPEGLECLDDRTLAAIVKSDMREHDELYCEGKIALGELQRRDTS